MTDIVERLRQSDDPLLDDYRIVCEKHGFPNMLLEAADEIKRLRRIEAAYNSLVKAEADLRRARDRLL